MKIEDKIIDLLRADNYLLSSIKPSKWAEKNRVMTTEVSNFPGPFKYDRTPYTKEIVDCLSPDHPAKKIAIMKGAQVGLSTGVIENGIGWIMSENPGNVLLAARDESLVKIMMDEKIDQMIDSCDLRHLIRPNVVRARNQRTGDTSNKKEFSGGTLKAFSIQKPGRMRQFSAQFGFLDDFEAAPVDKDAGGAMRLFETRFASYFDNMKLFVISTPEVKHKSNIEPLFKEGDQRRYFVPCPCCGDYITLEWRTKGKDGKKAGIVYDYDEEGIVIRGSVFYKCQNCGGKFTDAHKQQMNLAGEWRPTVKQKDPTFYSYHLSALYAPPGMYDWEFYVDQYLKAVPPKETGQRIKIDDYKVFVNTCLGETWEERGNTPRVSKLALNTRGYKIGNIPEQLSEEDKNGEIVMVTCACDLNGLVDDARLDYEIVAWTETGVSYSIDHGSIGTFIPRENTLKEKEKRIKYSYQPSDEMNVWNPFLELINQAITTDTGEEKRISILGVDTGHFTEYAYNFIDTANEQGVFTVGLKGKNESTVRKIDANTSIFVKSRERSDLYLVEVNQVKDELAGLMNIDWVEGENEFQPFGFMNFPTPNSGKYTMKSFFSHYESEHKIMKANKDGKEVGFIWEKRNTNVMNHFWDCRVYNITIKEILMVLVCKEFGDKEPNWKKYCQIMLG